MTHLLTEFKRLDKNMIREMDKVMTIDIPKLLEAATAQSNVIQYPRGINNNFRYQGHYANIDSNSNGKCDEDRKADMKRDADQLNSKANENFDLSTSQK